MGNQSAMSMVLLNMLIVCGYLFMFLYLSAMMHEVENSRKSVMVIVSAVLFGSIVGGLYLVLRSMGGGTAFVLMAFMLVVAMMVIGSCLFGIVKYWSEINKGVLALFAVYLVVLGYFTLFSRESNRGVEITLQFNSLREALWKGSFEPFRHFVMNVAMFLPVGVLVPGVLPFALARPAVVLFAGMSLTTFIEGTQMLFRLGQCDVEDLLANVLGAMIGYLLYRIAARFSMYS